MRKEDELYMWSLNSEKENEIREKMIFHMRFDNLEKQYLREVGSGKHLIAEKKGCNYIELCFYNIIL